MKLGLAVLPMDVWADVFVYPWISRQELARIVHCFKERAFAEKLQKFLHDPKCGRHTLRYLHILSKKETTKYLIRKGYIETVYRPSLAVSSRFLRTKDLKKTAYNKCEFPEAEMPENITAFKQLSISHLDDQVLAFLDKIKPLFNDVFIKIIRSSIILGEDTRILLTYLLPMIANIRGIVIKGADDCVEFLEHHFPGTMTLAKELDLELFADEPATIPAYLNWLNAPQDFSVHGPRFLKMRADAKTIFAIVDAVCKQFMAATASATFIIFLELFYHERNLRANEVKLENATTNEQLAIRNAIFEVPVYEDIHIVEILRHPPDANAKIQEWIEQRAYFGRDSKEKDKTDEDEDLDEPDVEYESDDESDTDDGKDKVIWINRPTISANVRDEAGLLTSTKKMKTSKKAKSMNQSEDESFGEQDDAAGPSTAKRMKKY